MYSHGGQPQKIGVLISCSQTNQPNFYGHLQAVGYISCPMDGRRAMRIKVFRIIEEQPQLIESFAPSHANQLNAANAQINLIYEGHPQAITYPIPYQMNSRRPTNSQVFEVHEGQPQVLGNLAFQTNQPTTFSQIYLINESFQTPNATANQIPPNIINPQICQIQGQSHAIGYLANQIYPLAAMFPQNNEGSRQEQMVANQQAPKPSGSREHSNLILDNQLRDRSSMQSYEVDDGMERSERGCSTSSLPVSQESNKRKRRSRSMSPHLQRPRFLNSTTNLIMEDLKSLQSSLSEDNEGSRQQQMVANQEDPKPSGSKEHSNLKVMNQLRDQSSMESSKADNVMERSERGCSTSSLPESQESNKPNRRNLNNEFKTKKGSDKEFRGQSPTAE